MDAATVKQDFPVLDRRVNGRPLVYLDNAATTQKPQSVIDAVTTFYQTHNANVHRGIHTLSEEATAMFDDARDTVATFLHADTDEIVFTANTTDALNLAAYGYGLHTLDADDEILLTRMEHHSMILPWQHVAEQTGATLRYVDLHTDGTLDMDDFDEKLSDRTAIVGVTHVSNVLGVENEVATIAAKAHACDAVCIVDGAQSVPHLPVDVQELGIDMIAFSGHKLCAPTGTGVLWAKQEVLEQMTPFHRGGGMINQVMDHDASWAAIPARFEAGTPNIAGVIGLAAAIDYLDAVGMQRIREHSMDLARQAYTRLQALEGVTVYGPGDRIGLVSFAVDGAHPHDVSTILDQHGVAVRGGHHCAQPLAAALGVDVTTRASFYIYNTKTDVDRLVDAVQNVIDVFGDAE